MSTRFVSSQAAVQKINSLQHSPTGGNLASTLNSALEDTSRCKALPFTMVFWLVFMATQVGHRQVRLQQSMQQALVSTLKSTAVAPTSSASSGCGRRLVASSGSSVRNKILGPTTQSLDSVSNPQGIMLWLSQSLVPQLWAVGPQGKGVLFEFDKVIGGIRIQQRRLGISECPGGQSLRKVYNLTCYNKHLDADAVRQLDLLPGTHVEETGVMTYWLDLASDEDTVQAQIDQMWEKQFFFAGTQSVWVQSILLNAQVSLMAYSEVHFFLDRAGRLSTKTTVFTLPTEVYGNDWLIWAGDMLMLLMVLGLLVAEALFYWDARRKKQTHNFWNRLRVLNWAMVILGTGFSIFFGYLARGLTLLTDDLSSVPSAPPGVVWSGNAAVVADWSTRHRSLDDVYSEVARLSNLLRWCELSTFWYSLLVLLKFFAVFEGSPRLAMITATLRNSGTDVFHFMVVFAVVFLTFALGAYFLFGHQLKEWSNILLALNSSFRALMGDFNFDDMYAIAPISAMVWFWIFMSLIFLVMLNMLLAIILDTYSSVKEGAKDKSTLWQQAGEMTKQARVAFLSEGRWSNASNKRSSTPDDPSDLVELMDNRPVPPELPPPSPNNYQVDPPSMRDAERGAEISVLREAASMEPSLHRPVSPREAERRAGSWNPHTPQTPPAAEPYKGLPLDAKQGQVPRLGLSQGRPAGDAKWFSQESVMLTKNGPNLR